MECEFIIYDAKHAQLLSNHFTEFDAYNALITTRNFSKDIKILTRSEYEILIKSKTNNG